MSYNLGTLYRNQAIIKQDEFKQEMMRRDQAMKRSDDLIGALRWFRRLADAVVEEIMHDIRSYDIRPYYDVYYDPHDPFCDSYVQLIRDKLYTQYIYGYDMECVGISKNPAIATIRIKPHSN